jgi:hypothetical protein
VFPVLLQAVASDGAIRAPVDAFVLAKLEPRGFSLAPLGSRVPTTSSKDGV